MLEPGQQPEALHEIDTPRPPIPEQFMQGIEGDCVHWIVIPNYRTRDQRKIDPKKPIHVGMLIRRTDRNLNLIQDGKLPRPIGSFHYYQCRACSAYFVRRQAPHMIRANHCGCAKSMPQRQGEVTQTVRLEGERFGNLVVIEYKFPNGPTRGGWDCICECGNIEERISSTELRQLRKLACRECSPEEYSNHPGRKTYASTHHRLLEEHRSRLGQ